MNSSKSTTFSDFSPSQIKQLKEAFELIDDNGDGHITSDDLKKIFLGLGSKCDEKNVDSIVKEMFKEFDGAQSITYPQYLSLMGSLLGDLPDRSDIETAMAAFCQKSDSGERNLNALDYDELVKYLKMAGFQNDQEIHKAFKNFISINTVTGKKVFKGEKFLETITG